jgi:hypothetical protein
MNNNYAQKVELLLRMMPIISDETKKKFAVRQIKSYGKQPKNLKNTRLFGVNT